MRLFITCRLFFLMSIVLLPSCTLSGLNNLDSSFSEPIIQSTDAVGDIEIKMQPVDVWDEKGSGNIKAYNVNEKPYFFRLKDVKITDQAWVRVGLYWQTKLNKVALPIVILGPPVSIKKIQFVLDKNKRITPKKLKTFSFTPVEKLFDKNLSSDSFEISKNNLKQIVEAKNITLIVSTTRGNLVVNLAVVTSDDEKTLQNSVKYLFTDFYNRMSAVLSQNG